MPQGLETYDASGNLLTSYTDSLTRKGGTITTNGADGSITDALIGSVPVERMWFVVQNIEGGLGAADSASVPIITVSGNTLTWQYPYATKYNTRIIWGVF